MKSKISFFLPSFNIGGVERVFINYANALSDKGYNVDFVVCKAEGVLLDLVSSSVKVVSLGNIQLRYSFFKLRKYIKKRQPDSVISGGDFPNIMLILAASFLSKRPQIIISQHNYYNIEVKNLGLWARCTTFLMKQIYPWSDVVIAVSKGIMTDLSNKIKLNPKQLLYLPNPIDIDKTMQLGNLPVPSLPNNFIVFIGRLSKVKNLKLLLNAFQHIKHQGYELLIVGDGQERSELQDCANNLERSSKIHFIGAVPNSMPYLKRAKVLALPSFSEALPTVLLEALAFSIPIVTTPNAGAVEILQDAKNAFISESFDNVEEFASLLDSAIVHCAEDDRSLLSKYYTLNILPQLERILQS